EQQARAHAAATAATQPPGDDPVSRPYAHDYPQHAVTGAAAGSSSGGVPRVHAIPQRYLYQYAPGTPAAALPYAHGVVPPPGIGNLHADDFNHPHLLGLSVGMGANDGRQP